MAQRTIFWRQSTQHSLTPSRFASERELQSFIYERMEVLGLPLIPLGRQIRHIDALALDSSGDIVVFELKNEALNRDALATGLQHMADINKLEVQELISQCEVRDYRSMLDTCTKQWGQIPNQFNGNQTLILLGASVENDLIEAIDYLTSKSDISIGVGTIQQFVDGQERFVKIDWVRPIYQNAPKLAPVDKFPSDYFANMESTMGATRAAHPRFPR